MPNRSIFKTSHRKGIEFDNFFCGHLISNKTADEWNKREGALQIKQSIGIFSVRTSPECALKFVPRPRAQKVTRAKSVTSGCFSLTWQHSGKEEASEEMWTLLCRRSARQSKLYEHQLNARHLDAPIFCGSRCERVIGEICAAPPSRFQRMHASLCSVHFERSWSRKKIGILTGRYGEHEVE